jgi:hypothetical protein
VTEELALFQKVEIQNCLQAGPPFSACPGQKLHLRVARVGLWAPWHGAKAN